MQAHNVVKMTQRKNRRGFHEQQAFQATRSKSNKTQRGQRQEWSE